MTIWGVLLGMGISSAIGLVSALSVDEDLRRALRHLAGAVVMGPVLLLMLAIRSGPAMIRLSPEALERWARRAGTTRVWILTYRNRGLIVIRSRDEGETR